MARRQVYDASAIQALKGLEPVRRMPGMYTHTVHPLHVVQEVIDNAIDEALAGYGKRITVKVFKDGSVEVVDEGRGIPVDMHPVEKKPAVEVAFSMLHAGGKFSKSGEGVYHISGGLHGVGVAVSNALSKRLEVTVYRDGKKHTLAFEGGELKQKLKSERAKDKRATGTVVRLWPDPKYFDSASIPMVELEHLIRSKAYLLPGLTTVLRVEGKEEKTWKYERGMAQYFEFMLAGRELVAPQGPPGVAGPGVGTGHRAEEVPEHAPTVRAAGDRCFPASAISTRRPRPNSARSRRAKARPGRSAGSTRARPSPTRMST